MRVYGDYRRAALAAEQARQGQQVRSVPDVPPAPVAVSPLPVAPAAPPAEPAVETARPGRFRTARALPAGIALPVVADLPELQIGLTPATEAFLNGTSEHTGVLPPGLFQQARNAALAQGVTFPPSPPAAALADIPKPLADATLESLPIGHHPFEDLSGTAGVGKTTLVRKLLELSPLGSVVLAATTGIAAVNLGEGTTIHALLGFYDAADLREKYQSGHLQRMLRKHRAAGLRRIIIDEKSMLHAEALTCLTRAVVEVNQPRSQSLEAVGQDLDPDADDLPPQIGLTLCGDFGQLPPVPDTDEKTKKKLPIKFAFESPEWPRYAEHRTVLTKVWRQDDQAFIQALHAVRRGDAKAALQFFTPDRFSDFTDNQFAGTTIVAKNDEVDRVNGLRLDGLPGATLTFDTTRWGKPRADWKQIPEQLRVKDGALVMVLANRRIGKDDPDDPRSGQLIYANGDLGVLEGRNDNGAWRVRLHRTGRVETILPVLREHTIPLEPGRRKELTERGKAHLIKTEEKQEIIGTVHYMPLRVAYACTVHKTQGLTLDQVQVNIRDDFFRMPGMLFVALSRARTAAGLRIVGNQVGFAERCRVEGRTIQWL